MLSSHMNAANSSHIQTAHLLQTLDLKVDGGSGNIYTWQLYEAKHHFAVFTRQSIYMCKQCPPLPYKYIRIKHTPKRRQNEAVFFLDESCCKFQNAFGCPDYLIFGFHL
eukprot:c23992_g1_i1 orf=170-496(-)